MNILCSVSYDGNCFSGWQKQPEKITVQSEIESALKKIYNCDIDIISAGRTDAGVHALCNYFNFHIAENNIPLNKLAEVINNHLPKSIRILDASEVSELFSARYNGRKRIYEYYIEQTTVTPFLRNYRLFYNTALDIEQMNAAAAKLIGEHDFSAFKACDCNSKTQIRKIYDAYVEKKEKTIIIRIEANAFLKNMIRIITGTLINIGRGKYSPEYIDFLLESRDRTKAGKTVDAAGLFLINVEFEF